MGAGAGYDVTIKGIELDRDNWKLINDEFEERYGSHTVTVEVPVKPCIAEEWAAEDYYYGVNSTDGIVLDGICVLDYYDEDKKIDGGVATLSMEVYPEYTDDVLSQEQLNEAIGNLLPSELDLTTPYGGGWSHADLPEEGIVFDDDNGRTNLDEGETYDYTTVRCELKCPNISSNINWFFENDYKLEDIFFEQEPEEEEDDWEENDGEIVNSRKPIKSGITDINYDAWNDTVPYDQSYEKEFDDMVEENGYDVNERFTYMAGIRPEDWTQEDTDSAAAFHVDVAGYYKLGDAEGMVLVGTLKDIYDYCDNYFGMGLHPDYVCPADEFDYEDGEWVTGGWIDSSVKKPIKSSITQRELKDMIRRGQAIDITYDENSLPEGVRLDVLQISKGTYGMNGALFKGSDGNLYAIAGRTSNLFRWV